MRYTFENRILVDMDGTIADFEGHFLNVWQARYPERVAIPLAQRTTPRLKDQYPREYEYDIEGLVREQGFYKNIPPLPGAITTLQVLEGQEWMPIWICTKPLREAKWCIDEKYAWVEQHLGKSWTDRVIITRDKTLHTAKRLIDDEPEITGARKPAWEHVVFDAPYNRQSSARRRLRTWIPDWVKEALYRDLSD